MNIILLEPSPGLVAAIQAVELQLATAVSAEELLEVMEASRSTKEQVFQPAPDEDMHPQWVADWRLFEPWSLGILDRARNRFMEFYQKESQYRRHYLMYRMQQLVEGWAADMLLRQVAEMHRGEEA